MKAPSIRVLTLEEEEGEQERRGRVRGSAVAFGKRVRREPPQTHMTAPPQYSSEESLCIAVGNDISEKYSCGPLVVCISAGEWSNREKEIDE